MDQNSLSDLRKCAIAMVQMNLTSDEEIVALAKTYNLVYKFLQKTMDSILPKGNLNSAMRLVDQLELQGTKIHFQPDLEQEDEYMSSIGILNPPLIKQRYQCYRPQPKSSRLHIREPT
jgi:hypothetical protein